MVCIFPSVGPLFEHVGERWCAICRSLESCYVTNLVINFYGPSNKAGSNRNSYFWYLTTTYGLEIFHVDLVQLSDIVEIQLESGAVCGS